MALIWQRHHDGNHYEVRSAGCTRRLYTNGICHSDYHPGRAVTGSVWDLLFLPALLLPDGAPRRVLVLGVGGGSVIHLLQRHLRPERITGVDLSRVHLHVARRFFGLRGRNLALYEAEAGTWLAHYAGPPFDLIIDDLFLEEGNTARRALEMDPAWIRLLLRHIAPTGILVANFADAAALRECGWFRQRALRRRLPAAFSLRTPYLDNVVAAFARRSVETGRLRRRLAEWPELERERRCGRLRYRIRRLVAA